MHWQNSTCGGSETNRAFSGVTATEAGLGVGEARPVGVMHELSHSYWGLFAVSGSPELAWDPPKGADISPAMESYHRDVLKFMAQPPDYYEPLRSRLRDLPELSSANPAPLFTPLKQMPSTPRRETWS